MVRATDGREVLIGVVSDGAGSAKRSEKGSGLAVSGFIEKFSPLVECDPELKCLHRGLVEDWLSDFRLQLSVLAQEEGTALREFACTFLAAIAGPESAICIQIGDGAIVGSAEEAGDYSWLTWPQHGEFANTTNFVTDEDALITMQFEIISKQFNEIALFSDGLERLILDMQSHSVHSPALRPIFLWLAKTNPAFGRSEPEPALETFLSSRRINERTDDDKTLVMGTRVVPGQTDFS